MHARQRAVHNHLVRAAVERNLDSCFAITNTNTKLIASILIQQ
jgi:hypothetical protein